MKILITIPNQKWVRSEVSICVNKIILDNRYELTVEMPKRRPYVNNLHHIVNSFIENDYNFWLNIDADNPPINNPLDLISLDLDIIGLPTPIWYGKNKKNERPWYWNVYDKEKKENKYIEHLPQIGLQKVDAVGTGCCLFSRRVFEEPAMRNSPFMRKWDENGCVTQGNDLSFCERATKKGFEIYAHFDYPCNHFYELSMIDVIEAFKRYKNG